MNTAGLAPRLMRTFLEELEEHVRALNRDLVALERAGASAEAAERHTTLLRAFHTLKGAARTVNVGVVADACHHLEGIVGALRAGERDLDAELRTVLFAAVDGIDEVRRRLDAGTDLDGATLAALIPELAQAAARRRPEAAPPPARTPAASAAPSSSRANVRVGAERLDRLLAGTGELVVAWHRVEARHAEVAALRDAVAESRVDWRSAETMLAKLLVGRTDATARRAALALNRNGEALRRLERELERLAANVFSDGRLLGEAAGRVDDDVRRVRMLPFADACAGLERVVRDAAHADGKDAELVVQGGDVELDRSVLEAAKDALLHLVRNAVSHGVEAPAVRRAAGKPARARIAVSATLRGPRVEIAVADDGAGIDLEAVRAAVRKAGLAEPEDDGELTRAIFESGLSTAAAVTDVAGRGVGLDVVKSRVEALHGTIDVASIAGEGVRFTIDVPLTLTTVRVVLFGAGGQTFAIAAANVEALVRVARSGMPTVRGRAMIAFGDGLIPVASLAETLGLDAPAPGGDTIAALILAAREKRVAVVVDELLATHEVVVKSLGPRFRGLRAVAGATILPSGRVALVLSAAHLVRVALGRVPSTVVAEPRAARPAAPKRVLVVDDSLTTRSLEKSILEAAGYETLIAADGEIAWRLLQDRGADVVVSDIEMPRIDGFALTEMVRGSDRFRHLPIVLVTGRESAADRTRGMQAGADAYLVKSGFDQTTLLDTIAQLL